MIPFGDILIVLGWLTVLYVCTILGSLALMSRSKNLVLRYCLGKSLGLIGLGAITWVLSLTKIVPFTPFWIWSITVALYAVVVVLRRKIIVGIIKSNWQSFLNVELVFVSLFIIGIALRVTLPKIEGIEKFMDAAILSGLLRHTEGIPIDTWYAPETINYYYFGQWIIAMLAKMSQTALAYAFNLGFATVLAVSGTAIFTLVWQLTKRRLAGLLALFLTLFASNLHPFIQTLSGHTDYFFFTSGRFIEQVINEYPLYSLILGDLHAHMLALMLSTACYLTTALVYLENKSFKIQLTFTAIAGGLTGLQSATNSFDVINCSVVFITVLAVMYWRKMLDVTKIGKLIVVFGLAFSLPTIIFMAHFNPAVGGVAVSLFKTPLLHMFWQFGLPIVLGTGAVIILAKYKKAAKIKNIGLIYAFWLAAIILIMLPQFIYLKDIYHYQNPPFARANTVFKIWYGAWPLVAISVAVTVSFLHQTLKQRTHRLVLLAVVLICLIALSFGLVIGLDSHSDNQPNTLNGLAYLKTQAPDKLEVLKWATENIKGQPVVLQAYGDSYTQDSWFSSYSGLPAIIGWQSHEWGWRFSNNAWELISARASSIKQVYESSDVADLRNRVAALGLNYILIGPEESAEFKINNQIFTEACGEPVFSNASYVMYSCRS